MTPEREEIVDAFFQAIEVSHAQKTPSTSSTEVPGVCRSY